MPCQGGLILLIRNLKLIEHYNRINLRLILVSEIKIYFEVLYNPSATLLIPWLPVLVVPGTG